MALTETLAAWSAGLRYGELPAAAAAWVKAATTDYLAVSLAACPAQGPRLFKRHALSRDRIDDCLSGVRRLDRLDSMRDFPAPLRFQET